MTSARKIKTHESTRTGDKTTTDLQGTLMTSLTFILKVCCSDLNLAGTREMQDEGVFVGFLSEKIHPGP